MQQGHVALRAGIAILVQFLSTVVVPACDGTSGTTDYNTWRDNPGASIKPPNDTTPSSVIAFDYEVWKANFGDTIGEGNGTNVPEPTAPLLTAIATALSWRIASWRINR